MPGAQSQKGRPRTDKPCHVIDANVILRYLLGEPPDQAAKAGEIMHALEEGEITVHCDPVTLAEVVWVLSSFYKLPPSEIYAGLSPIVKTEGFEIPEKERYILALELFARGVKHFGDACACAAALLECGGHLFSFDRDLSRVEGVTRTESL